jgi:3-hydroxybutyryl-CoA dehydrogenase
MLFGLAGRRSVMTTPVTDPECLAAACTLLSTGGAKVARLRDSSGFVAQRVVATIVNIGCDIAQQGIASPEDIDNAVQLGLGYPKGPLAFGDALGPARILKILESLSDATRDPRYRPSPWLTRRARLGVSLRAAEQ